MSLPIPLKLVGLKKDRRIHIFSSVTFADRKFKTMCGGEGSGCDARSMRYKVRSRYGLEGKDRKRCKECFEAWDVLQKGGPQ